MSKELEVECGEPEIVFFGCDDFIAFIPLLVNGQQIGTMTMSAEEFLDDAGPFG
jgi:hypothetical protein